MQFQMETRTCPCGCGVSFRVLITSPQKYASHLTRAKNSRREGPRLGYGDRDEPEAQPQDFCYHQEMKPVHQRLFEALKEGLKVDIELGRRRMEVCTGCALYDPVLVRCRRCRCLLKLKTIRVNSSCPLKKWENS